MLSDSPVLVDTCTLINLQASGETQLLLRALRERCMVCDVVSRESIFLWAEQKDLPPQRIDLAPFFQAKILHACQAESPEEEALYVALAAELDDGEALSLAISSVRGFGLATDDRKARRIAKEIGSVPLYSTVEIVRAVDPLSDEKLREMIRLIEFRGRFVPHPSMPLSDWWNAHR